MNRKRLSLYPHRFSCLCPAILLIACASTPIPYQALSDAKQALASAKLVLEKKENIQDINELTLAEGILRDGEAAINHNQHSIATTLLETSIKHSQAILKRHQTNVTLGDDIKFRY